MKLSAVLLAGGESRRMGKDKAAALFRGSPLWRQQLLLLEDIGATEILISARRDPVWRPPNLMFIPDEPPSAGPLSGIAAAMARMTGTHLLVLAVDMPLITRSYLSSFKQFMAPGRGVLPKIGLVAEPLAAIYPRECLPHFSAALRGGDFSVQRVTEKLVAAGLLSVVVVSKEDEEQFRSLNTAADLLT